MTPALRLAWLGALFVSPAAAADLRANPQVWSEIDLEAPIAPDWRVTGLLVLRAGDGLPEPALWGGGAIVDRRIGAFTLSAGDLEVAARSAVSGSRLDVNVPLVAASYTWGLGGFVFSDRSRFEDLIGVPGSPWRYRNRLAVERPLVGLGHLRSIFASEEAFYAFSSRRWERSRAQVGLAWTAAPRAEVRIYYLRQDDRAALPRAVNGLGLTLSMDLM